MKSKVLFFLVSSEQKEKKFLHLKNKLKKQENNLKKKRDALKNKLYDSNKVIKALQGDALKGLEEIPPHVLPSPFLS